MVAISFAGMLSTFLETLSTFPKTLSTLSETLFTSAILSPKLPYFSLSIAENKSSVGALTGVAGAIRLAAQLPGLLREASPSAEAC
jgi:hypothetical protein